MDRRDVAINPEDLAAVLRHRGPDALGSFSGRRGSVAQSRLAILDLKTGDPPITDEHGKIGAVLNGEIYNYREICDRLRSKGHRLTTACDTEVLAHLAESGDAATIARSLDGMFAFAIWNDDAEQLTLGRDRFGKKPLYWWCDGGRFVFGSEIKALLQDPAVTRRMNPNALESFLAFGYVPEPDTFYDGIHALLPGHVLTVRPGESPHVEQYWEPPLDRGRTDRAESFAHASKQVRLKLRSAVERRLVADVPLGAFLSGGIDSAAVVALMTEIGAKPVLTFSIGFEDGEGFDERDEARMIADKFRTQHTEFVVRPDKAELIERLVWHYDQPFGDSSALPTFLLSELTREHVTVALSGDGGDEIFGGYERFVAAQALNSLRRVPHSARRATVRASQLLPTSSSRSRVDSARRLLGALEQGLPNAYHGWVSYIDPQWRDRLLGRPSIDSLQGYQSIWDSSGQAPVLARLLDLNIRTYLLGDLLPKVDRMSMAHGLEVRSPFLDTDLAEYVLSLPPSFKVRGLRLKRILKASMSDVLPESTLRRRKHGFGIPVDRWFREDLATFSSSALLASDARIRNHLHHAAVRELVERHQAGRANHGHAIWSLLTLELFLRNVGW